MGITNLEGLSANSHPVRVEIVGGGIGKETWRIVDTLPEVGESGYVYLVKKETGKEGDIYDEYIWAIQADGKSYDWEHIGATDEVNLEDYYTKEDIDDKLKYLDNSEYVLINSPATQRQYADNVKLSFKVKNLATGGKSDFAVAIPGATKEYAGVVTGADYAKFSDAADQTETNTNDISDVKGDIAELEVDKLGIDNLLEGTGIKIEKQGDDESATLTISAEGSGVKVLTKADYNWPVNNPDGFAMWKFEPGFYTLDTSKEELHPYYYFGNDSNYNRPITGDEGANWTSEQSFLIGNYRNGSTNTKIAMFFGDSGYVTLHNTTRAQGYRLLSSDRVIDNLNNVSTKNPLSANQGRVLKEMIEALPSGGSGIKELTTDDYDYNYRSGSDPDGVALWLLEPGLYSTTNSVNIYTSRTGSNYYNATWAIFRSGSYTVSVSGEGNSYLRVRILSTSTGASIYTGRVITSNIVANDLETTDSDWVLSANQGKVLNDKIGGELTNLTTNNKNSLIDAINEVAGKEGGGSSVEVVQNLGTSTTAVMSQNAINEIVASDKITLGKSASASAMSAVAIGESSRASQYDAVAVGYTANASAYDSLALGMGATASGRGAVALGTGSKASVAGTVDISTTSSAAGYKSSSYRKITGVHDPEDAHDAATKGYIDGKFVDITSGGMPANPDPNTFYYTTES